MWPGRHRGCRSSQHPADGVTRAGKHWDVRVGNELPVRVPDRRPSDDVIGVRGKDREVGEGGGLSWRVRAPRVEVSEMVATSPNGEYGSAPGAP